MSANQNSDSGSAGQDIASGQGLPWERGLICLFLIGLAFAVYGNTFGNGWTYDDFPVVVENLKIRSLSAFLAQPFWPGARLMREFSYLVDYSFFQLEPAGYHLQNILWHAINACLLYGLIRSFKGGRLVSVLASVLFLIHPLQVEVVAHISHRKDSLVLCFALITFWCFHNSYQKEEKRYLWLACSAVGFLLALYSKQSALALPLIMVAYEACLPVSQRFFLKKPWGWLILLSGVVLFVGRWLFSGGPAAFIVNAQGHLARQNFYSTDSFEILQAHCLMVLKAWVFMWSKLLWPVALAVEYAPGVPARWLDPWVILAIVLLGVYCLTVFLFWQRGQRVAVFFLVATGLAWLPTSNLLPLSYYAADRYLYMPTVGVYVLVAMLLAKLLARQRGLGCVVIMVLCGTLIWLTVQQNQVWKSPDTLWAQALKVSPKSAYALNNMGMVYFQRQELQTAYEYFLEAVETDPYNPTSQYNLGYLNERFGQPGKALKYYQNFLMLEAPQFHKQREQLRKHLKLRYGVDSDE
jgi:hypothetical protein